jgi:hypothetical protein
MQNSAPILQHIGTGTGTVRYRYRKSLPVQMKKRICMKRLVRSYRKRIQIRYFLQPELQEPLFSYLD